MKKNVLPKIILTLLLTNLALFLLGQDAKIELVKNLNAVNNTATGFYQVSNSDNGIKVLNNKAFFYGSNGTAIGNELFITDGTDTGTKLLKDLDPRSFRSGLNNKFNYEYSTEIHRNKLYFTADTGAGNELWVTDGTTTGTKLVKDIRPTTTSDSDPNNFLSFHNHLFFSADTSGLTNRMYYTDGTDNGTKIFNQAISRPTTPFVFNNKAYITCVHSGAAGPYTMVSMDTSYNYTTYSGGTGSDKFRFGGTSFAVADSFAIYIQGTNNSGSEPYVINWNGTQQQLKDVNPGSSNGVLLNAREDNMVAANNLVFFEGRSTNSFPFQTELWKTDGTTAGTVKVRDIGNPTVNSNNIEQMIALNGKVYFSASNDTAGFELWVSDGTAAGTKMVKGDAIPGKNTSTKGPRDFYIFNNKLYYSAQHPSNSKIELWVSDGTAAGTHLVAELDSSSNGSARPDNFFTLNNKLYFSAYSDTTGFELYTLTEFFNISLGNDTAVCDSVLLKIDKTAKSYVWSNGDTSSTIYADATGDYWVEAIDEDGKVGKDTINVVVNISPNPKIIGDLTACGNTTIEADQTYAEYLWGTGQTSKSITTDTSISFLSLQVKSAEGCIGTDYQYITIDTIPNVSLGMDRESCAFTNLEIDSAYKVLWNDGDTLNKKQIVSSGTFEVKITDGNGCFVNDTIDITINPYPTIPFTKDTSACDSLTLNITQPYRSILWDNGDTTSFRTYKRAGQTSASIFLTDTNNCSASSNFYVEIQKTPKFILPDTSICGVPNITLKSPLQDLTYLWSTGSIGDSTIVSNSSKVWLKLTTSFGCTFTDTAEVKVGQNPILNLADTFFGCDSVTIDAGNFANYLWADASTRSTNTFYDLDRTWVRVSNSDGCFTSDTFTTIINYKPNSNFSILHSTNSTQFIPDAINNIDSFFWVFGDGNTSKMPQPVHSFEFMKEYTVQFIAKNGCGADTSTKNTTPTYGKPVSVNTLNNSLNISVYPNPAHGNINIIVKNNPKLNIEIYNQVGKLVLACDIQKSGQLNLSSFAKGIYFMKVSDGELTETIKIEKK